jgi:hypothetical protein
MSTFYNPELVRNQQQQELEHHYRMLSLDKDLRNKYGINRNQAVAGLSAPEQQEGIQASEAANATGVRADSFSRPPRIWLSFVLDWIRNKQDFLEGYEKKRRNPTLVETLNYKTNESGESRISKI